MRQMLQDHDKNIKLSWNDTIEIPVWLYTNTLNTPVLLSHKKPQWLSSSWLLSLSSAAAHSRLTNTATMWPRCANGFFPLAAFIPSLSRCQEFTSNWLSCSQQSSAITSRMMALFLLVFKLLSNIFVISVVWSHSSSGHNHHIHNCSVLLSLWTKNS